MALTKSDEAWLEARKAEGATMTALRIPRPPNFTGKVACCGLYLFIYLFIYFIRTSKFRIAHAQLYAYC